MSRLVMADFYDAAGELEAEPVLVESDGETVTLNLHDGTRLDLPCKELAAAITFEQRRAA